ncbi:MAG: hypothetical protein NTZ16_00725 [Verrucomicrobia bacterium]|nr:hypothetical protein [Verrucomicrobiota bacterium]
MKKKDIALLLSTSLFLAIVAAAAFFTAETISKQTKDDGHRQKVETFITNVQSGKWQLTTERWLECMRREDAAAEAYRKAGASTAKMMRVFAWTALAGMFMQIIVVLSVRKRIENENTKSAA